MNHRRRSSSVFKWYWCWSVLFLLAEIYSGTTWWPTEQSNSSHFTTLSHCHFLVGTRRSWSSFWSLQTLRNKSVTNAETNGKLHERPRTRIIFVVPLSFLFLFGASEVVDSALVLLVVALFFSFESHRKKQVDKDSTYSFSFSSPAAADRSGNLNAFNEV